MLNVQVQMLLGMLSVLLVMGAADFSGVFAAEPANPAESPRITTAVAHVDAAVAEKLVAQKKVVVLDIRTPKEYAAGHIAGATNLDFYAADFEKRLAQLDKSKTYLVHCASGGRSTKSLAQFQKLQFKSVVHLDGGFKAWQKAGQPVEK